MKFTFAQVIAQVVEEAVTVPNDVIEVIDQISLEGACYSSTTALRLRIYTTLGYTVKKVTINFR